MRRSAWHNQRTVVKPTVFLIEPIIHPLRRVLFFRSRLLSKVLRNDHHGTGQRDGSANDFSQHLHTALQ
jgi:hypothetical protein